MNLPPQLSRPQPSPERALPAPDLQALAELELERVERHEVALLLCAASALRAVPAVGGLLAPHPIHARAARELGAAAQSSDAWRRRARELLALAARDEVELPQAERWASLERLPLPRWPTAVELARTALLVEDGELARATLAHAYLAQGEPQKAVRTFVLLLARAPRPRERAAILQGLAAAHVELGRPRLALGAFDQAADDPASSALALISALYLAFSLGDSERAARSAARLDLVVDPSAPDFAAALARLRSWVAVFGQGLPWKPENRCAGLFRELLRTPTSPAGRVCRSLS